MSVQILNLAHLYNFRGNQPMVVNYTPSLNTTSAFGFIRCDLASIPVIQSVSEIVKKLTEFLSILPVNLAKKWAIVS